MLNNNRLSEICSAIIKKCSSRSDNFEKMQLIVKELHESLDRFFWVGFYFPRENEMIMGPSAGPPACNSIGYEGVCGKAFISKEAVIVPDVDKFPGHITCDPNSRSEIVIPVLDDENRVISVLDIDSDQLDAFSAADAADIGDLLNRVIE